MSTTEIIPYTVKSRPDTGVYNAKLGVWLFLGSEVMLFGAFFSSYILLRLGAPAGSWPHGSSILNVPIGTFNTLVLIISSVTMVMSWASLKMHDLKKYKMYLGLTIFLAMTFLMVKSYEYGNKFEIHYEAGFPTLPFLVLKNLVSGLFAKWHWYFSLKLFSFGKIILTVILLNILYVLIKLGMWAKNNLTIFLKSAGFTAGVFCFIGILLTLFELGNRHSHHNLPPSHNTFMAIYFTMTGLHGLHVIGGIVVNTYNLLPGSKMWSTDPERLTNRIEVSGLYWHFVDLVWIFLFPVLYLL